MLTHLRIQYVFAVAVAAIGVLYHFLVQVVPGFRSPWTQFQPERMLPYASVGAAIAWLLWLRGKRTKSYKEMLENSPGIAIDNAAVTYGTGHPAAPPKA